MSELSVQVTPAWVALGSNLLQPQAQLRKALQELSALPLTRVQQSSRLYRSPPLAGKDQPDYCNAVACLATGLPPDSLLRQLHGIESTHGRRRPPGAEWDSRTLDCDLLLYEGTASISGLTLPHPGLLTRSFVLQPLSEISPELALPDGRSVADAASDFESLPEWPG